MISKHEISSGAGAASYFSNSFAKDGAGPTDNYYVNEQAMATWAGNAAQILRVSGKRVNEVDFVAFLDGKLLNPITGAIQDLTHNSKGADRRAGWDFTVSAPKSVSLAGLVGMDARVLQAHRYANATAMAWLERHGAQIRVKDAIGENVKEATGNLIYATVTHETSRDNEPQLHNHNVIVAATFDKRRGKWRSLTNDELFKIRSDGDVVYKATLAKELRKAGYVLDYAKDGVNFEIQGIAAKQLEAFSSRTRAIDSVLIAQGLDPKVASWEARQAANLGTRSKKEDVPREVMHAVWQDMANSVGLDVPTLVKDSKDRAANPELENTLQETEKKAALESVSWAVDHLSSREQSFKLAELEKTAIEFGQVSIAAVQEAIHIHTKEHLLVVRDEVQDGMTLMTTTRGIAAERQMHENIKSRIGTARSPAGVDQPVLSNAAEFKSKLDAFEAGKSKTMGVDYRLTDEQVHAAKNMLMHPDAYQAIQGDAGTGKTAVLEFVREVAQAKGWLVRGVAVSSSAAQELEASSGIQTQTLAGMFAERDFAAQRLALEITALRAEIAKMPGPSAQSQNVEELAELWESENGKGGKTKKQKDAQHLKSEQPGSDSAKAASRIEIQRLAAKSANIDFGEHRYVFDHAKGAVFRGGDGLQDKMAQYLVDLSARLRAGELPKKGARSMGVKLSMPGKSSMKRLNGESPIEGADNAGLNYSERRANYFVNQAIEPVAIQAGNTAARGIAALGESMMTYQKVGTVEAIAARNALYTFKASARDQLVSKLHTKHAELLNLHARGNTAGAKMLWVMDESSMGGAHEMEKYTAMANVTGARVVIQGDEKQHGSVPAGRAFVQIKNTGVNISVLQQTRRFDKSTQQTQEALALMKRGMYGQAMARLDAREVTPEAFASVVAHRFVKNLEELKARGVRDPKVGVVTLTNRDRKAVNTAVQAELRAKGFIAQKSFEKGHLSDPKLTSAEQRTVSRLAAASVDRLVFRKKYEEIDVARGDVVVVTAVDVAANRITVRNARGQEVQVNPDWHDFFTPARAETRAYSVGDRVEARAIIRTDGQEIKNGTRGSVFAINDSRTSIRWDHGSSVTLDNSQIKFVDLAYAHTSFKEQGATNDREIIAVSKVGAKVFNQMAAYVSATRARDNTEIVTTDLKTLVANADALRIKTVATEDPKKMAAGVRSGRAESFEEALGRILREHQAFKERSGAVLAEGFNTKPVEQIQERKVEKTIAQQRERGIGF
jgi:conjugative relaxase-like TrwC/TraI family protein